MKPLRTSDIAKAAGIHPNTVRKYEELGHIPRPERGTNGYRRFTERHLDQARLAATFLRLAWLGPLFKQRALETVLHAAADEFAAARDSASALLTAVAEERRRAERAAELLDAWAASRDPGSEPSGLRIKEAAAYLNVTEHSLRSWDRNRLVTVPRDPTSGYRTYGPAELRRLTVIRALRRARFNVMSILNMFRQMEVAPGINPQEALESLPPGEEDLYHSTYRWLTRLRETEAYTQQALAQFEAVARRWGSTET